MDTFLHIHKIKINLLLWSFAGMAGAYGFLRRLLGRRAALLGLLFLFRGLLGLLPFVRIGDIRRPYVLRMLDIGARGLIVPNIRTPEEVRELVSAAKFPPLGNRGFCPNRTTGWGADEWSKDVLSYMEECNRRCRLIPQCETREALEQIEEIAALPGVDGIFVGPCDLSIALGVPLQFDHPLLTAAVERILKACRDNGKESYIFAGNMQDAVKWAAKGFDSVTYSLDASVFIQAFRALVARFHSATE